MFGLVRLNVKSKTSTSSGVEFSAGGSSSTDGGKVSGSLETMYKIKERGLDREVEQAGAKLGQAQLKL